MGFAAIHSFGGGENQFLIALSSIATLPLTPPPLYQIMLPSAPVKEVVKSQPFKRAQHGLFQSKTKQYGNNVPFSLKKTRRTWLPNVQSKRLTSDILGQTFKLKVTTRALATVKKVRLS